MCEDLTKPGTVMYGILKLNSRTIYGIAHNGGSVREFIPIHPKPDFKILVPTKKDYQLIDVYCIIKIEKKYIVRSQTAPIYLGIVQEYMGNVGDVTNELEFIRRITTKEWKNNKKITDLEKYESFDLTPDRKQLFDQPIISIDPKGCLDIDDALHIIENESDYQVGVHIADVSSYIQHDSELDKELQRRVESIYLPAKITVNMLPPRLATEICSLKKGKISRAYTVLFTISKKTFEVISVKFQKTNIIVTDNLSYEEAEHLLKTNNSLALLFEVGNQLNEKIYKLDSYDIHKMIEVYMLLTNNYVATELAYCMTPNKFLVRAYDGYMGKDIIENVDKTTFDKFKLLNTSRANYVLTDNGSEHFHKSIGMRSGDNTVGMRSGDNAVGMLYTHFTSPIRRYADIIVHRMLSGVFKHCEPELIDYINTIHAFYSKYERFANNLIMSYVLKESNTYTANIISLDEPVLHVKELDMILRFTLIPKKILGLFVYELNPEKTILKITSRNSPDKKIELKLFDKVQVSISVTLNTWSKLNLVILNPDLKDLYYGTEVSIQDDDFFL